MHQKALVKLQDKSATTAVHPSCSKIKSSRSCSCRFVVCVFLFCWVYCVTVAQNADEVNEGDITVLDGQSGKVLHNNTDGLMCLSLFLFETPTEQEIAKAYFEPGVCEAPNNHFAVAFWSVHVLVTR